jgi:hypothetical protein
MLDKRFTSDYYGIVLVKIWEIKVKRDGTASVRTSHESTGTNFLGCVNTAHMLQVLCGYFFLSHD